MKIKPRADKSTNAACQRNDVAILIYKTDIHLVSFINNLVFLVLSLEAGGREFMPTFRNKLDKCESAFSVNVPDSSPAPPVRDLYSLSCKRYSPVDGSGTNRICHPRSWTLDCFSILSSPSWIRECNFAHRVPHAGWGMRGHHIESLG